MQLVPCLFLGEPFHCSKSLLYVFDRIDEAHDARGRPVATSGVCSVYCVNTSFSDTSGMPRNIKAIKFWREMSLPALLRFSLAAFLLFGALGLVSILIESSIRVHAWHFVVIQAFAFGGMAACILLFGRRRWWITVLLVVFWNGVMILNGGGVSFLFSDSEGMRVRLGGPLQEEEAVAEGVNSVALSPTELDAIFVQRGIVGVGVIVLLIAGYMMFTSVIRAEIRRRARLESEVRIAQGIQQSLLPAVPFESPGCSIYGATLPAGEVGGDYFDIVSLPDGRLALAIADVTGHGVGAGILSAMTKSALRLQLAHDANPESVLLHLNEAIYEVSDKKTFVTFAYALISPSESQITLATAGHPPVIHRAGRSRVVTPLRSKNVALGMRRDVSFPGIMMVRYQAGDLLLLYTDGLLEVTNSSGEQFGEQLHSRLARAEGSPREITEGLLEEVRRFSGHSAAFEDDISLMCVRFEGVSIT